MTKAIVIIAIFSTIITYTFALQCYDGFQRFEPPPTINNVTLVTCRNLEECCYMLSSIDGTYYGCYDSCPRGDIHACGPDPKLNIMDLHYCYCKDWTDENCRPYLNNEKKKW